MQNKTNNQKLLSTGLFLVSILAILLVWTIASFSVDNSLILPNVIETIKAFPSLLKGDLLLALKNTLIRCVIAFAISYILAFIFALLSQKSKVFEGIITPFIAILRALPTVAIVLLLYFWTTSSIAPVIVTTLVVLPTVYTNLDVSFSSFDKGLLEMCTVFNVSKKDKLKKVVIPQIVPDVLRSVGTGLSLNLKLIVAAEVLSETANCMGYLMSTAKVYFETASMICLVLITVIIGLIIETVFNALAKKVGDWR